MILLSSSGHSTLLPALVMVKSGHIAPQQGADVLTVAEAELGVCMVRVWAGALGLVVLQGTWRAMGERCNLCCCRRELTEGSAVTGGDVRVMLKLCNQRLCVEMYMAPAVACVSTMCLQYGWAMVW
jgi:hypothetical protein